MGSKGVENAGWSLVQLFELGWTCESRVVSFVWC